MTDNGTVLDQFEKKKCVTIYQCPKCQKEFKKDDIQGHVERCNPDIIPKLKEFIGKYVWIHKSYMFSGEDTEPGYVYNASGQYLYCTTFRSQYHLGPYVDACSPRSNKIFCVELPEELTEEEFWHRVEEQITNAAERLRARAKKEVENAIKDTGLEFWRGS